MTGAAGEWAPAKVNLFLHVLGRRDDGYHLIDSLAVFADVADRIEARPCARIGLTLRGPGAAALANDTGENLVLRAARSLASAHGIAAGAALTLDKQLPVASGIGGGSADAAATLRLLHRLWNLRDTPALGHFARALGADVPVCLACEPARMGGIGEMLTAAPNLPVFGLLLVNPGAAVATADVFRARHGAFSSRAILPSGWRDAESMAADLAGLANDLEAPAVRMVPAIGSVLEAVARLPGCLLAH